MANYNALVSIAGVVSRLHTADNLIVGSGVLNEAGALPVNGVSGVNIQLNGVTGLAVGSAGGTLTQPVATSGTPAAGWIFTGAAHTGLTAAEATMVNYNLASSVQFTSGGTIALQRAFRIQGTTYTATAATQTITNASTLALSIPIAGTNVAITNRYALNIESGSTLFGSTSAKLDFTNGGIFTSITGGTSSNFVFNTNMTASSSGTDFTFTSNSVRTAGNLFTIQNNLTTRRAYAYHGGVTMTQGIAASGTAQMMVLNGGAHTSQTLSTEIPFVDVNQGTVQWATGALTTQRNYLFRAPTLAFVGASTVTSTATVAIDNQPQVGTNATLTNAYALWVQAGAVRFDGTTIGFLGAAPVVRQTAGANFTNNVTSGGSSNTLANYTDLVVYSNDAATIRNDIYQLGQSMAIVQNALRLYGLLT